MSRTAADWRELRRADPERYRWYCRVYYWKNRPWILLKRKCKRAGVPLPREAP